MPRLKARQIQGDVILIDRHRAGSVRIERVQSDPADKEGRRGRSRGLDLKVRCELTELSEVVDALVDKVL